ncbi:MAG TPA: TrkH family potassium uptake protein, partial [Bacteroidales bacterium]|nr:TrkH family potassium uptake protein [Bacteroidales bacterium]
MKSINIRTLLNLIGLILMITGGSFLTCIPVALIYSEPVNPFIISSITILIPGFLLFRFIKSSSQQHINVREGYLGVTLSWITLCLAGVLPYIISGTI